MKREDRSTGLGDKIFFLNQLNRIRRIVNKVDGKSHRLGTLAEWTSIALTILFWTIILSSFLNAIWLLPVLLTHPPYPESRIPEECLYEGYFYWSIRTDGSIVSIPTDSVLHNPTYAEMEKFLKEDKTNQNEYNFNKYVCHDFSMDLIRNAAEKGIRAGYVGLRFPIQSAFYENNWGSGHALVCFDTTDKGLVFIESITDEEVRIVVGKSYWQGVVGKNLWGKIEGAWNRLTNNKPSFIYNGVKYFYDDTVEKVSIYWNGNDK